MPTVSFNLNHNRNDIDDGSEVGPLLDQVAASVASFTGDYGYGQESVSTAVAERHPEAAVIVPPRSAAVPSETAGTEPTQWDRFAVTGPTRTAC
jgi:hypothetical protein